MLVTARHHWPTSSPGCVASPALAVHQPDAHLTMGLAWKVHVVPENGAGREHAPLRLCICAPCCSSLPACMLDPHSLLPTSTDGACMLACLVSGPADPMQHRITHGQPRHGVCVQIAAPRQRRPVSPGKQRMEMRKPKGPPRPGDKGFAVGRGRALPAPGQPADPPQAPGSAASGEMRERGLLSGPLPKFCS